MREKVVGALASSVHFLDGGGEMASSIRAHCWSSRDLGPPDCWPSVLKTAVSMVLNSKVPKCLIWGPRFISIYNDAFLPILGDKPPAIGCSFHDIWAEAWTEIGPIVDRAYSGEATFVEDFPLVIDRHGHTEQTYFTFCYSPVRDENGMIQGILNTVIETTGKVTAQRQARLLNRELVHRIKNTLAVVSAIINQTLQSKQSDGQAREALAQRVATLAQAQSLLTSSAFAETSVRDVVEQTLRPFDGGTGRCHIEGPAVMLSSRQALTFALAINELGTNALKYGALSNETGQIHVTWTADRRGTDDEFHLSWVETGGPTVVRPLHRGFGSRIIERALAQDFMGEAQLIYDSSGMRCELRTQMAHVGETHGAP